MCILSGCDYVASIPGLGIKKAHALIQRYGSANKVAYLYIDKHLIIRIFKDTTFFFNVSIYRQYVHCV